MDESRRALIAENINLLSQLRTLITQTSSSTFQRQHPDLGSGSIGEQVRHVLNHYESLLRDCTTVDYENRTRGSSVETAPSFALFRIDEISQELQQLAQGSGPSRVRMPETVTISGQKRRVHLDSTMERELSFLASHTTHHLALIRILATVAGSRVPSGVGLAKSTQDYRQSLDQGDGAAQPRPLAAGDVFTGRKRAST